MQNQDEEAKVMIFLAAFVYCAIFYIFKSFYYLKHRATFNEMSFVFFLPIVPIVLLSVAEYAEVNDIFFKNFFNADAQIFDNPIHHYQITLAGLLSLPYFFFATYILIRSRLRYQFIRWRGHSEGGPPAGFIALILTILIPISYGALGYIYGEIIFIYFAFTYFLVGLLSLIV